MGDASGRILVLSAVCPEELGGDCQSNAFPLCLTLQSLLTPQVPGMRLDERFLAHPTRGIGLNPQGNCQWAICVLCRCFSLGIWLEGEALGMEAWGVEGDAQRETCASSILYRGQSKSKLCRKASPPFLGPPLFSYLL